jgi:flagellar assembly protein FliH
MLSKVISRRNPANASPMVFRTLTGYVAESDILGTSAESGDRPGNHGKDDGAALRERLQQVESRNATERHEAFEAGRLQGQQQAGAELQPVLERLNASITEVLGMRPDLRRRAERDAVQLALLIAKRVLHRQLSVDEGALTAIARVAFERLTRSESYRVTVNPRFASAITAALPGNHAARVEIDSDPGCPLGTLIIHSAEGTIDASVDAQLEEINRGLTDRLAIR